MKQETKAKKTQGIVIPSKKIDVIVPFEDDLDYIKDYDGNYGLDDVSFRSEFEVSPDGKHILRPVYEVNKYDRESTFELLRREAYLLGKEFGYDTKQIQALFKDLYRIVYMWYVVNHYPCKDLRYLVKTKYFKSLSDIEDFIILIDDFSSANEVFESVSTPYMDGNTCDSDLEENDYHLSSDDMLEDTYYEENDIEKEDEILAYVTDYDKNKENEIFERISHIVKQIKTEKDPEVIKKLEEEKKGLIAQIYRMREEFLMERDLTYLDFIIARREKQIEKSWGWVKYQVIQDLEEENTIGNKKAQEKAVLEEKLNEINTEIQVNIVKGDEVRLNELKQRKARIQKAIQKIEWELMTPEEKTIAKIHQLIDKIRRLGKNKNVEAYNLSQQAKMYIKSIKDIGKRQALYSYLNETWQKRKERFKSLGLQK